MHFRNGNIISGNAKVVRNVNRSVILNIIREMQPISRVQLAKMSGLNKSTVSSIVAELLGEQLVFEEENQDRNVGRNPINLRLKLGEHFVGAINIDSGTTRLAIADIDGSVKDSLSIPTESGNPEAFVRRCVASLLELRKRAKVLCLEGIGVSVASIVDPVNSIVTVAPNLGWKDFAIGTLLQSLCADEGVISVDNDSKSSALAELWFGKHDMRLSNFVFLSVGRGIGTGIVVEGKLLAGQYHASGEFGHMTLFEGGHECACGNLGCWEAYASDKATVTRFSELSGSDAFGGGAGNMQDIIDLAVGSDARAREVLAETGRYLGLGISNILKALDPQAVIVGGRVTQVWDILYPEIARVVNRRAFLDKSNDVRILPTSLTVRPELLGAATLAIKEFFNDYKITI